MTSELITFNHLRCHSCSSTLGTRTGYRKPIGRGTDETPQYLRRQPKFDSITFIFSENVNQRRESWLEVYMQNTTTPCLTLLLVLGKSRVKQNLC